MTCLPRRVPNYDKTADLAKTFFKTIQNKLVFAVTRSTAAELTDRFLLFNDRRILTNPEAVSHMQMESIINERFGVFESNRRTAEAIEADKDSDADLTVLENDAQKLISQRKKKK